MPNSPKKFLLTLLTSVTLLAISGCSAASSASTAATISRQVPVTRGDLVVSVSVDGNLVMPQAFDLHFGAPGDVEEVLVSEGDHVKAGAMLARLDDTAQRLDVKSANNAVQQTLSNLYETVPRLPQFPTSYYNASSVTTGPTIPVTTTATITVLTPPGTTDVPVAGSNTVITTRGNTPTLNNPGTMTTTSTTTDIGTTSVVHTGTGPTGVTITTTVTPPVGVPVVTVSTIPPGAIPTEAIPIDSTTVTTSVTTTQTSTTTTLAAPEGVHNDISYQMYYPNSTALISYNWALDEVARAYAFSQSENYSAAASELYVALSDLEACLKIYEDAVNNPQSGLGNTTPFVPSDLPGLVYLEVQQGTPAAVPLIVELRNHAVTIKQGQADIGKLRDLIAQGKSDEAGLLFETLLSRIDEIGKTITMNVNLIKQRDNTTIYGKDISLYLYGAAEEKLNAALAGIQKGGLNAPELNDNLRIARHYMELCNGILGSNEYVLQHGLSLKAEQGYKLDLEKAMVNLGNSKDNFLNTVILAPVDGIVVSVGVKKNDVLSQQDYSSKGTIQIVDISQIKFQGTVDEIDIMKIKTGQTAIISVDAMPDRTFSGKVSFISPFGIADTSNVIKFNVTILLDPTDVDLKGGLTATADIGISTVESALLLPLAAVTTTGTDSFVTAVTGEKGQSEKRQVTLGIQNQQYVQILKGLNEGDMVIIVDKASGAPVSTTTMGPPGGATPAGGEPPPGR